MDRMRRGCLIAGLLIGVSLGSQPSEAQYTANFQTNIISGVTTSPPSPYFVGSNTFADVLLIKNGGVLALYDSYMGYEVSSSNNTIWIADPGSAWSGTSMYVGYQGAGNRLIITNGGQFFGQCVVGILSTNNSVVVTGTGSVLSNKGPLYIGDYTQGNRLEINNGGRVSCSDGNLGGGVSNSALVTDVGSVWSNTGNLYVGTYGAGNTLVVSNGGRVIDSTGSVGKELIGSGSNNCVIVTGSGSVWSNGDGVVVGQGKPGNRLVISKGGWVIDKNGTLDSGPDGSNSTVLVVDAGSMWLNLSSLMFDYWGSSLMVSNGGQVVSSVSIMDFSTSAIVTGMGSIWSNRTSLSLGNNFASNSLTIDDGGKVISDSASIGNSVFGGTAGNDGNTVQVTGTGSVWSVGSSVSIGYAGISNSVQVTGPGSLWSVGGSATIGYLGGSNRVQVAGTGSIWSVAGSLSVGLYGKGNSLMVSDGTVLATNMIVGDSWLASNNVVQLDNGSLIVTNVFGTGGLIFGLGPQGVLRLNSGTIIVDRLIFTNGSNALIDFKGGWVSSGGTTLSNDSVFAVGDGARSATFYMVGGTHAFAGGFWIRTNAQLTGCGVVHGNGLIDGALQIDCGGTSSFTGSITNYGRIEVKNGATLSFYAPLINYGQIIATNGTVWHASAFENHGTLLGNIQDGLDVWTNASDGKWEDSLPWSLGTPTAQYRCVITNTLTKTVTIDATTASVQPDSLKIIDLVVAAPDGSTNVLWINNPGSPSGLQITNGLAVGSGGKLVVSNGSMKVNQVYGGSVAIDGEASLTAASLTVSNGPMILGQSGTGQMAVSSSTVLTRETWMGQSSNSSGLLTVTGGGSTWKIITNFNIGFGGAGNGLVISNGGQVLDFGTYVGYKPGGSNNSLVVTGSGSVWSNNGTFSVNSAGNRLIINNGGRVFDNNGTVGSVNNTVVVTDPGSVWTNSNHLAVGSSIGQDGNSLVISNGGKLVNASCDIGGHSSVVITGTGSVWSSSSGFSVSAFSTGTNRVVVSNGGKMVSAGASIGPNTFPSVAPDSNVVLVTGPGSLWSNSGTLMLAGNYGWGNNLVISNSGQVINDTCYVGPGSYDTARTGNSNSVRVVDGGIWRNNILYVGYQGSSNYLVVAGGTVTVGMSLTVGASTLAACDNFVQLDSGSLIVTNQSHTATLDVRRGKFILNGGLLQVDKLVMNTACGQFVRNGGTLIVGTVVLDPGLSALGDGIPNGWKQNYGFDPFDPAVANADSDGDGMSNLQEFLAGSNPTNGASSFRITSITQAGSDLRVTWLAGGGRKNVVQAMVNPGGAYFNTSPNIVLSGAGDVVTNYLDKGGATNTTCRFYRVAVASSSVQDTTAPTLVVASPADNSYTTDSAVTVTGTSTDASGIAGVTVNGLAASGANGYSNWTVMVNGLGVGTNTLTVLAGDNAAPANFATKVIHVIYAAGSFDGNGDGLPDLWQIQYFGCVGCPRAAPGSDPDGDGMSNPQEYLAGTDPTNSASSFRITSVAPQSSDLLVTWTMGSGRTNALQAASSGGYNPNGYTDIFIVTNTVGTTTNYLDIGGITNVPARYYRVRVVP